MMRTAALVSLALLCASAHAVTIDIVPVGNPANGNDPITGGQFGGVGYAYRIGKFEVTLVQYTEFLNAVAVTDTYSLYNPGMAAESYSAGISRSNLPGSYHYDVIGSPDDPVSWVSWGDAARFCNWLHNGQPTGAQNPTTTERGAYTLDGATTMEALSTVTRNPDAKWFIPTENEWYKAAYHKNNGTTGDYWIYPTTSNTETNSDQPPGDASIRPNVANIYRNDFLPNGYNDGYAVTGELFQNNSQNYLTDVGAYEYSPSPYGTFDQGGNVQEWTETLQVISDNDYRVRRGGWWGDDAEALVSSFRDGTNPTIEGGDTGFRVARAIPEPSTLLLVAIGRCGLLFARRKRSK